MRAVDDVSLDIHAGETLGLVGESGSGKSTLGRLIFRLIEPTSGSVRFEGRDLLAAGSGEMRGLRRDMQIIFQDPFASLDPRFRVQDIIAEPLIIHGDASADRGSRAAERRYWGPGGGIVASGGPRRIGPAAVSRTNFPAGSASALGSPALSRCVRSSLCAMSRSRHST